MILNTFSFVSLYPLDPTVQLSKIEKLSFPVTLLKEPKYLNIIFKALVATLGEIRWGRGRGNMSPPPQVFTPGTQTVFSTHFFSSNSAFVDHRPLKWWPKS